MPLTGMIRLRTCYWHGMHAASQGMEYFAQPNPPRPIMVIGPDNGTAMCISVSC